VPNLMTETEGKIATWLDNKRINYNFQSSLIGGRSELAGMIIPFIVPDFNLALRIRNADLYDGVNQTAVARMERAQLHNLGFVVVDAHEEDITRNVDEVMNRAIEGREMSDLDSDLWFPFMGMFKGIPTFAGITGLVGGYGDPEPYDIVAATVQTDAATGIAGSSATLNGTLTYDGGGDCSVRFQFGTSTSYGTDTAWQTAKLTNATFSTTFSGLTVGTTYHYRAQARNKYSTVNGSDASFVAGTAGTTFYVDFYPDAHPEVSSVDGMIIGWYLAPDYSWAAVHDGINPSASDPFGDYDENYMAEIQLYGYKNPTLGFVWIDIRRSIVCFDTSSIGSGASIVSATLTLYCGNGDITSQWKCDNNSLLPSTNIYSVNPASATTLIGADFNTFGTTPYCDTPITYANWGSNVGDSMPFVLNSTGLAAISKTGLTKIGVRNANYDAADVEPDTSGVRSGTYLHEWTRFCFAEGAAYYNEPQYRPKLTIIYTV